MTTFGIERTEPLTPPHSIAAEQSVLGALLLDNEALDRITESVSDVDFYRHDHRLIFSAICHLIELGKPADVITVFEVLNGQGKADDCGGLHYLNALAQNTPSSANIVRYAEIVRNRALARQLIAKCGEIIEDAYKVRDDEMSSFLDSAEVKILAIREKRDRTNSEAVPIQSILPIVVDQIDELYSRDNPSPITGVPTGFSELDTMTSGLQPGDLIIVAGRPSMGKTAFAINIGEHVALTENKHVVIYSMEMGNTQLVSRMISSVGSIDQHRLRSGKLIEEDWVRLTQSMDKLNHSKMFIDDTGSLSPMELRARARRLYRKVQGNLGLVIVDYLQLMVGSHKDPGKPENRVAEVAEISRSLKALAKELQCPVIALSQLNRSLESRPNKRPMMSDLRESGAIEQDADVIMFLYRDEVYNPESSEKGLAEVIIGKQRNGPIGTINLKWLGQFTKFKN